MKIIINADDFGYSSEVNRAIVEALKNGLISSTTMLVNMPGFEEATELSKTKEFKDRIGIHLNLFEGRPLTKEMQKCKIFCDENGIYHGKKIQFFAPLKVKSGIIYNELHAQIEKAINAGIQPTHLDSHAHRHTNYLIGSMVIKLAKCFNIPSIRIHPNLNKRRNRLSKMMVVLYNRRLKRHGIKCSDFLGNIPEVTSDLPKLKGIVELIIHPVYKNQELSDLEYPGKLIQLIQPALKFKQITYKQLNIVK